MTLAFTVPGIPAPQGSKRHVGHGILIESSKKTVQPWRDTITAAAINARTTQHHATILGPVGISLTFTMPRPKSHWRTGKNAHLLRDAAPTMSATRPDLDKLTRAVLDALTIAGVWRDDSQVAELWASKGFTSHLTPVPGLAIVVDSIAPDEPESEAA